MANRYAVATGNWSNPAIWDGGTLPQAGDVVRPNGFTVTIDQSITVAGLRDDASAPAVLGGQFRINTNISVAATEISCNQWTNSTILINNAGGDVTITATINGNIVNNGTAGIKGGIEIIGGASGRTIINGVITSQNGGSSGSSGGTTSCVIYCATGTAGYKLDVNGIVNGTLTNGAFPKDNVTIALSAGYELTIVGVINGTTNTNPSGLSNTLRTYSANNIINIYGNINGSGTVAHATLQMSTSNICNVYGIVTPGSLSTAITGAGTAYVSLMNGAVINDAGSGPQAIYTLERTRMAAGMINVTHLLNGNTLYSASSLTGYPPEAKTEENYVFGPSGEFTGTLTPWDATFAQALATAQRDLQLPSILSAITAP